MRPLETPAELAGAARRGAPQAQMTPMARGLNAAISSMTLENAVPPPPSPPY